MRRLQKSDIGVQITSKPITVGPNEPVVHTYRVFAGPKTAEALAALRRRGAGLLPQDPVDPVRARYRPRT